MAENGNTCAVVAPGGIGLVQVYRKDKSANPNSCWIQLGSDIISSKSNDFGTSLAMTEDGSRLVVGGLGFVQVFEARGEEDPVVDWVFIKEWESSPPSFGYGIAVSISENGMTIAVGGLGTFEDSEKNQVHTYEEDRNGSKWDLMMEITGEFDKDSFGQSLSLSLLTVVYS